MQRFKSHRQAQDFLAAHAIIYGHFRPRRHRLTAVGYRRARTKAFRTWRRRCLSNRRVHQHHQHQFVPKSVNPAAHGETYVAGAFGRGRTGGAGRWHWVRVGDNNFWTV